MCAPLASAYAYMSGCPLTFAMYGMLLHYWCCFDEVVKFLDKVDDDKIFERKFEKLNWLIEPFGISMHIPQPSP